MIEMLAVLAIIGVLSIIALLGFTYAMNKLRANDTIRDVNLWALRATEVEHTYPVGQTIPTDDIGYKSTHGYDIAAVSAGDKLFAIELVGVSDKVCQLLLDMAHTYYVVEATNNGMGNGIQFDGNDTSICSSTPTLYFYFDNNMNKPTDVCLPACGTGETCCNNSCYPTDGLCGHLCACPDGTECKGDGLCCLPESEPCNGTCCPATQMCINGSCSCPEGASINEEGQCVCPAGSMLIDNKCQSIICTGSGSNYTCTDIYGNRCGTGCNEDGSLCKNGYCQNYCPRGAMYAYIPSVNFYGCTDPASGVSCYNLSTSYGWICLNRDEKLCGRSGNLFYTGQGDCINQCTEGWDYEAIPLADGLYGCTKDTLKCVRWMGSDQDNTYSCYKNNLLCGTWCTNDGKNCQYGECIQEETDFCVDNMIWSQVKDFGYGCLNELSGVFCIPDGYGSACYNNQKLLCGKNCYTPNGTVNSCAHYGCYDYCPDGLTYTRQNSIYGCSNGNGLFCYHYDKTIICQLNNKQCGRGCTDYFGNGDKCKPCRGENACPENTTPLSTTGCYNPSSHITCEFQYSWCYDENHYRCGAECQMDGNECKTGACTKEEANCPAGTRYTYIQPPKQYGCVSNTNPIIACYKSGDSFTCYKDWTLCGSNCTDYTGAGCSDCQIKDDEIIICPEGTSYQPTTGLCTSPDTTMGCVQNNASWDCITCAIGSTYGDLGNGKYGCINDNGTKCYPENDTFTCIKNGVICGTGCLETGTGGSCNNGCV